MLRYRFLLGCISFCLGSAATAVHAAPSQAHHARGSENVFWFVHVSDIHIGSPLYPKHGVNLQWALTEAVEVIQPWFVVASGDLCDGATGGIPTLGQSQEEWDEYVSIYESSGMTPDFYFDLPGNHDGYGDPGMNYYLANSLLGRTHSRLYTSWTVELPAGEYLFYGLNSAGEGSGSFFEDPAFMPDEVEVFEQTLQAHASSRLLLVFAHHRLNQPENNAPVRAAIESMGGGFYMHGHVHEYDEYLEGNDTIVVNEVDSLAASDEDNLAIGVVDHDALIYRATGTSKPFPFVMVTAPVSVDLRNGESNPFAYEVCLDREDNPVRAMVFSKVEPDEVTAQIGSSPAVSMVKTKGSVWSAEVDTTGVAEGIQDVTVTATVGGETVFHKVRTSFVAGPCDPLPDDPPPSVDGGVDGGEAGLEAGEDVGTAGAGGTSGAAGAGGSGGAGAGAAGSAGEGGSEDGGEANPSSMTADDGGCACTASSRTGRGWWVGLLVLGWGLRRRRSQSS